MDLKHANPEQVVAAMRKRIALYRVQHRVTEHVKQWFTHMNTLRKKTNERHLTTLRVAVETEFPGSYVRLTHDTSRLASMLGRGCFTLEIGGVGEVMRYSCQYDLDSFAIDVDESLISHRLYAGFATALEDRIPDVAQMAQDYNAAVDVLKSVARRCKAREGLDVPKQVTYSPMSPLSDFFHGYEFIAR